LKGVQQIPGKDLALFLDVGYLGEKDYSSPEAFESSPLANILVSKTAFPENQQAALQRKCISYLHTVTISISATPPATNASSK
jgi:hypothetical protein